jgi:hypothetical protein
MVYCTVTMPVVHAQPTWDVYGGGPAAADFFFSLNTVVLFLSLLSSVGSCNWARLVTS